MKNKEALFTPKMNSYIEKQKENITKFAVGIEYDGNAYSGWQKQKGNSSIQACLEQALSKLANEPIIIFCAGRTDSGVHATGQVVHFETFSKRSDISWMLGVNSYLPDDISIRWIAQVEKNFHARFSAISRRYRYIIYNQRLRPAILSNGLTHYRYPLDSDSMERAGQFLLGENDFTSFCKFQCQSYSSWRNIHHLKVIKKGYYVIIDIKANAFLYHMVRNIVGSLIEVGCGNRPEHWISELLSLRKRNLSISTSQAKGLYLVNVEYPSCFSLPILPIGPLFLSD